MKKFVSLILTVCFIFLAANVIWLANAQQEQNAGSIMNLSTVSELLSKLESVNVDASDSSAYEVSVLIELEDFASENGLNFDARNVLTDTNDIDSELQTHRDRVKKYYAEYNENIASTLELNDYEYYVSYYSPYIEIVFDNLDEYSRYESELFSSLSNPDAILSVCSTVIVDDNHNEATYDSTSCTVDYLLTDAFEDIGVSDSLYTGNGVKVGIIDVGVPYAYNLKSGKYTMITSGEDMHSTVIASIIGGTSGIAENVHFYCMKDTGSIINDSNLLINTYGVNIINMSLGYVGVGYYTRYDACVDNIVSNTGCTFVKSAGNRGQSAYSYDRLVTAPGCSLNAITVGSVNNNGNVSVFSSWVVSDSYLYKPDVVAPGERLWDIPNISNENIYGVEVGHSGTSYAAPMVVGTIALLMEEFTVLKTNPALVKSVLHLGAEKLSSQTNYLDQQAGFGLINYQNMRSCLLNANYSIFNIANTSSAGAIVASKNVTLSYLDSIEVNANSIVNSSTTTSSSTSATPTYTNYAIKIYDVSASTYVANSSIDSSVDYLLFTNNNANSTSFRIDIVLEEDSGSNETEIGSVAYKLIPHPHSYLYRWVTDTHHERTCRTCGAVSQAAHVVGHGSFSSPDGYGICLQCRGKVFMGLLQSVPDGLAHTDNGSYILTNGTIVLVDEDIEAYMAGTLEFYYGEKE